jgi:uncharacterized membrane protein YbhN (UPF0104 family)
MRRTVRALKLVVTVGVLAAVLAAADLPALGRLLVGVSPAHLAAAVGVLMLQTFVLAVRFRAIVAALGRPIGARFAVELTFVGVLFNQALPSAIGGDALRAWRLRGDGRSLREAVTGVLLDRGSGVVVLALLAAAAAALEPSGAFAPLRAGLLATAAGGVAAFGLVATADRWRLLPRGVRGALERSGMPAGARTLLGTPLAATVGVWSAASHGLAALAAWLLAAALGVDVELGAFFAAALSMLLVTMIPLSYAGWGVREAGAVWLFALVGVDTERALAISVLFGAALAFAALPGVPFWLATPAAGVSRPAGTP